jgi:hypothetical protein
MHLWQVQQLAQQASAQPGEEGAAAQIKQLLAGEEEGG